MRRNTHPWGHAAGLDVLYQAGGGTWEPEVSFGTSETMPLESFGLGDGGYGFTAVEEGLEPSDATSSAALGERVRAEFKRNRDALAATGWQPRRDRGEG